MEYEDKIKEMEKIYEEFKEEKEKNDRLFERLREETELSELARDIEKAYDNALSLCKNVLGITEDMDDLSDKKRGSPAFLLLIPLIKSVIAELSTFNKQILASLSETDEYEKIKRKREKNEYIY